MEERIVKNIKRIKKRGFVYNLKIKDNHNYFVNRILTHNCDESSLIDDDIDAGIFRMLGGKGKDTFLLNIGNPFLRNHFLGTWHGQLYKKVYIDYKIGLVEGRYTPEFIAEAKTKPRFDVLFECKFPPEAAIDTEGWMPLLTETEVATAMQGGIHFGEERMGADPADEGINESVIVKRSKGYAEVMLAENTIDPMDFVGQIVIRLPEVNSKKIYIDRVGVGSGPFARLREVNRLQEKKQDKFKVTGVNAGEKTLRPEYFNKRAEMYWEARKWIKQGGKLSKDPRWMQLAKIKYKAASGGKIQIMSKEEMRKRGITSPDVPDAFAITFYDPETVQMVSAEDKFFIKKMAENKRKKGGGGRLSGRGYGLRMTR